jgi:hypothetical protein
MSNIRKRTRLLEPLLLLLSLSGVSCKQPAASTPDAAYQSFLKDVTATREGRGSRLLEDFDQPTRDALVARAKEASSATGDFLPADATYQLLQGSPPSAVKSIKVVEQNDDHATLSVELPEGVEQVAMVRESGRWKVHLPL